MTGIKLADLLQEMQTADVHVGGAIVHLEFRALWDAEISSEDWEEFKKLPVREYWAELLARLVKRWDLVDDEERALPITAEAIAASAMPNRLLQAFADAITGSAVSGKVSANGSRAT